MLVNDAVAASARDGRWTDVVRVGSARPMVVAGEESR
jgi:hypothetical protein